MHAQTAGSAGAGGDGSGGESRPACSGRCCDCRRRVAALIGGPQAARLSQYEACESAARLSDFYADAFWSVLVAVLASVAAGYALARILA